MIKFFIVLCLFFSSLLALDGKVIKVADGDTITILTDKRKQIKIRLHGIDAPQKKQAYGEKSREFLSSLIAGKIVNIKEKHTDRYGRTVGVVYYNNTDINKKMVENGYAWAYTRYSKDYVSEHNKARASKFGLSQEPNPIEPSIFRKHHTKQKSLKI